MTTLTPRDVFRGNPPSDDHQPDPVEVVTLLDHIAATFGAVTAITDTLAELNAVSGSDGDHGLVLNDGGSSGVYSSDGSTWTKTADLPPGVAAISAGDIDNAKLANMSTNRIKGRVSSGTGAPEDLTKAQAKELLGLDNVDNTADADKPVSTATQTALDGKAASGHTHTIANVTGLQSALDGKADNSDIGSLEVMVGNKAPISHTHTFGGIPGLTAELGSKVPEARTVRASGVLRYGDAIDGQGTLADAVHFSAVEPSEAAAIAGTDATTVMTPRRTKHVMDVNKGRIAQSEGDFPGLTPYAFTTGVTGIDPDAKTPVDVANVINLAAEGMAYNMIGDATVARIHADPLRRRVIEYEVVLRRLADVSDPGNDTVELQVAFLDDDGVAIGARVVLDSTTTLAVGGASQILTGRVTDKADVPDTIQAPDGAVYADVRVRTYGDGQTAIVRFGRQDVTTEVVLDERIDTMVPQGRTVRVEGLARLAGEVEGEGTLADAIRIGVTAASEGAAVAGTQDDTAMTPQSTRAVIDVNNGRIAQSEGDFPGLTPYAFTTGVPGIVAGDKTPVDVANVITVDDEGVAYKMIGDATVARIHADPIQRRILEYQVVVQRLVDPPDPSNDRVELQIAWLDETGATVGAREVVDFTDTLKASTGAQVLSARIAGMPGVADTIEARAGAVYADVRVRAYGSGDTALIQFGRLDVTETHALTEGNDISGLIASINAAAGNAITAAAEALTQAGVAQTAATQNGDVRQDQSARFEERVEFDRIPAIRSNAAPGQAYAPTVTRLVIADDGDYTHVPSIAFADDDNGLAIYLRNTTVLAESQTGQEIVFRRTSDGFATQPSAAANELTQAATCLNPLDPVGDGNIQGESFVTYDPNRDKYIVTNVHRANAATNRAFVSLVDPGDPTVNKAQVYGYVWDTTTGQIELSQDVTGVPAAGKKFTKTIGGAESQVVGFKPTLTDDGRVIVPLILIEGGYGNLHRLGFAIHAADDFEQVTEGTVINSGEDQATQFWEPSLVETESGGFFGLIRNTDGSDGPTNPADNLMVFTMTPDLLGASPARFMDHDLHVNRHLLFRVRPGLYCRIGTSHKHNRNAMDVAFAGQGDGPYGVGYTFSTETDGAEFAHYVDGVQQGGAIYAMASFGQVSPTTPRRIEILKFDVPLDQRWVIAATDKNVYEEGGTAPSVSGMDLTLPPQQMASLMSVGAVEVLAVNARVTALPNAQPYTPIVIGTEVDGHLHLEVRLNGTSDGIELWAAERTPDNALVREAKIRDLPGPLEARTFTAAINRVQGVAMVEGYAYAISGLARAFAGDIHPELTSAHAGDLVLDAGRSSATRYTLEAFARQFSPEVLPQRIRGLQLDGASSLGGDITLEPGAIDCAGVVFKDLSAIPGNSAIEYQDVTTSSNILLIAESLMTNDGVMFEVAALRLGNSVATTVYMVAGRGAGAHAQMISADPAAHPTAPTTVFPIVSIDGSGNVVLNANNGTFDVRVSIRRVM